MNSSAIVMLVFAVVVLYGGLVYYMVKAAKGKNKKWRRNENNCIKKL